MCMHEKISQQRQQLNPGLKHFVGTGCYNVLGFAIIVVRDKMTLWHFMGDKGKCEHLQCTRNICTWHIDNVQIMFFCHIKTRLCCIIQCSTMLENGGEEHHRPCVNSSAFVPTIKVNHQQTTMTPFVDDIRSLVLLREQAGTSRTELGLRMLTHSVSLLSQTNTHILSSSSLGPTTEKPKNPRHYMRNKGQMDIQDSNKQKRFCGFRFYSLSLPTRQQTPVMFSSGWT